MKSIQRYFACVSVVLSGMIGCAAQDATTASEPEPVEEASQELQETTCATTATAVSVPLTGAAPTTCGTIQEYATQSSASYNNNPSSCPFQFVAEVARSNNSPIGSGYYFVGAPYAGQILSPDGGQTACEKHQASYAAWALVNNTWSEVGTVWMKGKWNDSMGTLFPCTFSTFSSSGALNSVPASATKIRIAAADWVESGTKGADGSDTYHGVKVGIGAGASCPP